MKIRIILIGMKACGKTTIGKLLADKLKIRFVELDHELEEEHHKLKKERLGFREIFKKYGQNYFRSLETAVLKNLTKTLKNINYVFACGGGTPIEEENRKILKKLGRVIYLKPSRNALYKRIIADGIPAFFPKATDPKRSLIKVLTIREPIYRKIADTTLNCETKTPEEIVKIVLNIL